MSDIVEDAPSSSETTTMALSETEPTLEVVMQNIFSSCDVENSGVVLTSRLIEYITPFMPCNMFELIQLREMLDPDDKNVCVNREKFYSVMSDWAGRISAAAENESFHEATPRDFDQVEEKDFPFVQSTPRSSFGHHLLRGYTESGIINISSFSACSESNGDRTFFEEQVKELVHQNRKLTEELTQAKVQLTSSEEQIENLQANLDKVVRRLTTEQQANDQLQKNIQEADDARESTSVPLLQYEELKKQKLSLEKDIAALKENLFMLDNEKADLMQRIEEYDKREYELKEQLLELHKDVELREEKISSMEDVNVRLKMQFEEQQRIGEDYKKRSEELLAEKHSLEKILLKHQLQQNLTTTLNRSCHIRSSCYNNSGNSSYSSPPANTDPSIYYTPYEKIRKRYSVFNNTKLLKQFDSPLASTTFNKKISDDSPDLMSAVKSSTPRDVVNLKYILDDSVPAEIKSVPALCPPTFLANEPSPPAMYVIERSDETQRIGSTYQVQNSSEEDYWKFNVVQMVEKQSPHDSLHTEMSEVSGSCVNGKDCPHLEHLMERNRAVLSLQYELLEHENCGFIIEKQRADIERLKKQQEDHQKQMELYSFKINELKCQLCSDNTRNQSSSISTTYITEVKLNLEQDTGDVNTIKTGDTLQQYIDTIEKEKQNLSVRVKILEQDKESLEKLLMYYKEKISERDGLRIELEEASKVLDQLKNEFQTIASENCSLKENVCALESSIKVITISKMKLIREKDELMQANETLKLERATVEKEYAFNCEQLKEVIDKNKIEIAGLEMRVKDAENVVSEKNDAIKKLENELTDEIDLRIQMKRTYEKEVALKSNEIENLSNNFKNQKDINNNLLRNLSLLEGEIKSKNNIIADMENIKRTELDFYSQSTNVLKDLNNKLQQNLCEKEKEFNLLNMKYDELKRRNESLSDEIKILLEECSAYKNNTATESIAEIDTTVETLKSELEQIRKQKEELESKLTAVEAEKLSLLKQKEAEASLARTLHSKSLSARIAAEELVNAEESDLQHLKSTNEHLINENSKFKDLLSQFNREKIEWHKQKEELLRKEADTLVEVALLRQKLDMFDRSDASTNCSLIDRKDKEILSFSRMQMKVDKLQGKLDNVQDLLESEKKKNAELQLQICDLEASLYSERKKVKEDNIARMERNELELKLAQSNELLAKAEHEIIRLKNKLPEVTDICVADTVSDIHDLRLILHESNVRLVSLLEEIAASQYQKTQSPHGPILNSWYNSIKQNAIHSHLDSGEPTIDILDFLVAQTASLKEMVIFNKQFSDILNNLIQERNYSVSSTEIPTQSFTVDQGLVNKRFTLKPPTLLLRPVSPPNSSNDVIEIATNNHENEDTICDCGDSSSTSMSAGSSSHSNSKEDDEYSLDSAFEELSPKSAFPNLPDALLEFLTHHQDSSSWGDVSDMEIEEKYGILMTALTTDDLSIKHRFEYRKTRLIEMKQCFLRKLTGIYTAQMMEDITHAFSRVCVSAEIFGAMKEEVKIHKCIKLIQSYVATVLNRKVEDLIQYQSTRIITRPLRKKMNWRCQNPVKIIVRKCFESTKFSPPSFASGAAVAADEFITCEQSVKEISKKRGKGIWGWFFCGICILAFLTIFIILGNGLTEIAFSGDEVKRFFYPLKDLSWDEFTAPFSKKVFCIKECPH